MRLEPAHPPREMALGTGVRMATHHPTTDLEVNFNELRAARSLLIVWMKETMTMKTMTTLVGATMMVLLVGCGGADDSVEQSQDMLQADEGAAAEGCYSTRDKKEYRAGEKVVGNHTVERCPADVKICLAPDSDSTSECQASGEWFVTTTPGYVTGGI